MPLCSSNHFSYVGPVCTDVELGNPGNIQSGMALAIYICIIIFFLSYSDVSYVSSI